jgi:chromosome segregation ATPase
VEELLSGLPGDAKVRVLRDRLARAEQELKRGAAQRRALHRQLRGAAETLGEAARERETLAGALRRAEDDRAAAEARSSKAAAAARTAKEAQRAAEAKLASRKAPSEGAGGGDAVRLGRAEAEIRRLREALVEARAAAGAVAAASGGAASGGPESAALGALRARLTASERQRADLLGAFRKQMRLVELLKRQRAHIEAARLLGFTEESFAKALKLSGAPEADRIV